MARIIRQGIYQYYKEKFYLVLGKTRHSETKEPMVLYLPLYGVFHLMVRPATMFFEHVNIPEYNYREPRFQFVKNPDIATIRKAERALEKLHEYVFSNSGMKT